MVFLRRSLSARVGIAAVRLLGQVLFHLEQELLVLGLAQGEYVREVRLVGPADQVELEIRLTDANAYFMPEAQACRAML